MLVDTVRLDSEKLAAPSDDSMRERRSEKASSQHPQPHTLEQWLEKAELVACALTQMSSRDLSAAAAVCQPMRTSINGMVVPERLTAARRQAKDHGFVIRDKPGNMSYLEYLHQAEEAARAAAKATADRRSGLPNFLDHILVEAAMRRKLDEINPRVQEILLQLKPDTNAATINRLHDEARALEDEIRFGHVFQMLGGAGFGLGGGGSAESGPGAAPSASHL